LYAPSVRREHIRTGALVVILFALVLTPTLGLVPLGTTENTAPVGEARGQSGGQLIDDFEDGDMDGWERAGVWENVGFGFESQNGTQITSSEKYDFIKYNVSDKNVESITAWMYISDVNIVDNEDPALSAKNPSAWDFASIRFNEDRTFDLHTNSFGSWEADQWYRLNIRLFYSNNTYKGSVWQNGEKLGSAVSDMDGSYSSTYYVGLAGGSDTTTTADDVYINRADLENPEISGTVTDRGGNAIGGATVEVTQSGSTVTTTTTSSDGSYSVYLEDGDYTISASKSGFDSKSKSITVSGSSKTVNFSLAAPTPTPTPAPTYDYTLQMCYQGDAEFRHEDATATWQELDIAGTSGWGAEYDPKEADTTTTFDSDRTTVIDIEIRQCLTDFKSHNLDCVRTVVLDYNTVWRASAQSSVEYIK